MSLKHPELFFASVKAGILGPSLSQEEVDGCNAILKAMDGAPLAHTAYALATAYHETATTMQPICERGGQAYFTRMYDITGARPEKAKANGNTCAGDGCKFYGRGYVQLTWRSNYKRAGEKLSVDLCATPERALEPEIAAQVMRRGMDEGWFTGKRFRDYLPSKGAATHGQFVLARRIINGQDRASDIATYADKFQTALAAGGWE